MTDLELSLIAIGGTIVVGVFIYNKWQEYRAKKSVERAFSSDHDDVLMEQRPDPGRATADGSGTRQEPSFGDDAPMEPMYAEPQEFAGGQLQEQNEEHAPAERQDAPVQAPLPVDEMVDCLIPVGLAGKVRGERVLQAAQSLRHVGNKPVHVVGLREDGIWETIQSGNTYVALNVGIQLANRTSMLNEIEFSELVGHLRQFGDQIDAEAEVPDMTAVMKRARGLHQLINQFDAKLSVNIQSNGAPWAINTLLAALERQGFDLRPDGRLVMPDGDGGTLFSLSTNETLAAETSSRLTLLLDVPCVAPQRAAFAAMTSFAKLLASRLGGTVVDDSNQPLAEEALQQIAGQVAEFCGEMEAAGVPAGSTRALRLFS
ncbi:MAG TPA: cell division protein ZipA C-terminal FtsZ-binding domain-containing protein [Burkholderiaceae bacterium]